MLALPGFSLGASSFKDFFEGLRFRVFGFEFWGLKF